MVLAGNGSTKLRDKGVSFVSLGKGNVGSDEEEDEDEDEHDEEEENKEYDDYNPGAVPDAAGEDDEQLTLLMRGHGPGDIGRGRRLL
ncbi:hypothetical protein C8A03DRAFT_30108 [Achaetomium macrosporum]|uniref:Uncharacterized protein n=1 Tax=Achaetomium macrosporum TaxID=79813 RepID=A0AAN7HFP2_9PEZI|nr:hypothetical protein C8A03DRAFT_30108 [Achaetomium macrosporum]